LSKWAAYTPAIVNIRDKFLMLFDNTLYKFK